jgi:hypothetical protein
MPARQNQDLTFVPASCPLDPDWPRWSLALAIVGGALGLVGALTDLRQFAYSYLLAFMFFLSICLGALWMVMIHHLFDASWSTPIRRVSEHLAFLLPVMALLFIPIAVLAKPVIYPWMSRNLLADPAVAAKQPLFTPVAFFIAAAVIFAAWTWLAYKLRAWSLRQDRTGAAECTFKLRKYSAGGIYLFALTLSLAAILWVKSLEYQWYSTMYGVYFFAASVWVVLATLYVLTVWLQRSGPLRGVIHTRQYHDLGELMLAFTVFYAYIAFSQYFLIWNAAIPEETFWYVRRENGTWWDIGMVLIFGHFALPFLVLLRIDAKLTLPVMIPLCGWAWAMHFCDLSFNIMPVIHPRNFWLDWRDLACLAFIGGVLGLVFARYFNAHPPYPIKDPRLGESLGVHHVGARGPAALTE